jgi:predicted RNA-binding Zn-ribbon protein involved in translation (DUF1610 family)
MITPDPITLHLPKLNQEFSYTEHNVPYCILCGHRIEPSLTECSYECPRDGDSLPERAALGHLMYAEIVRTSKVISYSEKKK